jgi:hypothetical protein
MRWDGESGGSGLADAAVVVYCCCRRCSRQK